MKKILPFTFLFLILKGYSTIQISSVYLTIINSTYHLDLNNDGITDFDIVSNGSTQSNGGVYISCPNSSAYLQVINSKATAFSFNNSIGGGTWSNSSFIDMSNFYGQTSQKFLGLKVVKSGITYYGWARIDSPTNGSNFTIYEYAYQDSPNITVLAGETSSVGLNNYTHEQKSIKLHPNPVKSSGTLIIDSEFNDGLIEILDLTGKTAFKTIVKDHMIELTDSNLPVGLYFIKIYLDGKYNSTKKLVLQN